MKPKDRPGRPATKTNQRTLADETKRLRNKLLLVQPAMAEMIGLSYPLYREFEQTGRASEETVNKVKMFLSQYV